MTHESVMASDRAAISDLVATYASALDRRRYDQLQGLFVPGALVKVFENPRDERELVRTYAGGAEFAAYIASAFHSYLVTTHFLGQQTITVESDSATAEVYCLGHHVYEKDGEWYNRVVGLRYEDSYVRTPDGWRFSGRSALLDWVEHRPMAGEPAPEGWLPVTGEADR